jgi:hypothetical protein
MPLIEAPCWIFQVSNWLHFWCWEHGWCYKMPEEQVQALGPDCQESPETGVAAPGKEDCRPCRGLGVSCRQMFQY